MFKPFVTDGGAVQPERPEFGPFLEVEQPRVGDLRASQAERSDRLQPLEIQVGVGGGREAKVDRHHGLTGRLVVDHRVNEVFPVTEGASSAEIMESGTFYGVMHPTTGTATIYRLRDGDRILRFANFRTSNGPDVHVYLVAANDARDNVSVTRAGFIDLGSIKRNIGDQNYALGPDVELSKYRTVSVWCKRFSINFGVAPLRPQK